WPPAALLLGYAGLIVQPESAQVEPSVLNCSLQLAVRKPSPPLVMSPFMKSTEDMLLALDHVTPAASHALTASPAASISALPVRLLSLRPGCAAFGELPVPKAAQPGLNDNNLTGNADIDAAGD